MGNKFLLLNSIGKLAVMVVTRMHRPELSLTHSRKRIPGGIARYDRVSLT